MLRALLARFRGDAALAAGWNRQALAHLGEDDWLMRSFVRWNQAAADWLAGRVGPAERGLAEVLAELRAADEAVRRAGGEPAEVFRAVEGGAGFFAGFLAMRSASTWARCSAPVATWMRHRRPTGTRWARPVRAASHPIWAWRTSAWPRSCTSGTS